MVLEEVEDVVEDEYVLLNVVEDIVTLEVVELIEEVVELVVVDAIEEVVVEVAYVTTEKLEE